MDHVTSTIPTSDEGSISPESVLRGVEQAKRLIEEQGGRPAVLFVTREKFRELKDLGISAVAGVPIKPSPLVKSRAP